MITNAANACPSEQLIQGNGQAVKQQTIWKHKKPYCIIHGAAAKLAIAQKRAQLGNSLVRFSYPRG